MNAELEESLDAVGGVLVAGVQRLDDGEPLGVLVLARAADDSDVGLRRRHPVDAEEAERVAVRLDAAAVEHGREHERLAGAVLRAGDVEPLRPADDGGAELVALGELVVDDGGGAEEEVLERGAGRQVAGVDEGDVLVATVAVAVALDDGGGGRAAEAGDVGDVVAVDEVAGALRQRHRALDREDVVVRPRERELPVRRRARHHARHDARRRLRPAQDVVHEERQLVVVARAGTTTSRAHPRIARRGSATGWHGRGGYHRVSGRVGRRGQRVDRRHRSLRRRRRSRRLLLEDAAGERAVRRRGERDHHQPHSRLVDHARRALAAAGRDRTRITRTNSAKITCCCRRRRRRRCALHVATRPQDLYGSSRCAMGGVGIASGALFLWCCVGCRRDTVPKRLT